MKVLLIIPAYNEEKNILKTCSEIMDYNKQKHTDYDLIVINDGSKDKTKKILEDNNIPHVNLLHNLGIGGAVQTGYKYAYEHDYDVAIQFDGDGQHDINYVKDIIEPISNNKHDMVIGSRYLDKKTSDFKSTKARQFGIRIISFFMKLVTKKRIYDTTSGFRACNKKIIDKFSKSYPVEYPEPVTTTELLKQGYRVGEVPVNMKKRIEGKSSIRAWKNFYYMLNVCLSIIMISIRRYKDEL